MAAQSPEAASGWPTDAVEVARIVGAWGVKGWIRLQPFASDPQALFSSRRWHLMPPAQAIGGGPIPPLLHVIQAKSHGDGVVAAARELGDRDAARALRGARVFVPRSSFPTAACWPRTGAGTRSWFPSRRGPSRTSSCCWRW